MSSVPVFRCQFSKALGKSIPLRDFRQLVWIQIWRVSVHTNSTSRYEYEVLLVETLANYIVNVRVRANEVLMSNMLFRSVA